MVAPVDYCAGAGGIVFGLWGVFGHGNVSRGTRAFLASFSSGGSVVYLLAMSVAPLGIDTKVMASNPIALFGALMYAAIITVLSFMENLAQARRHHATLRATQAPHVSTQTPPPQSVWGRLLLRLRR